ncbi:MAG: hypothetical protein F4Y45_12855 [Acidobacteria bacterium]|nr:hypothetical protein [Acidobacteriota bacterium]
MFGRAFVFGRTPCEVTVRPVAHVAGHEDAWIATVATHDGRPCRARFRAATFREALALAALHLERRLGRLSEAPPPRSALKAPGKARERGVGAGMLTE